MKQVDLKQIMNKVFQRDGDPLADDAEINRVAGWDSLNHISLMIELQKQGLPVGNSDMPELTSYLKIKAFVERHGVTVAPGTVAGIIP